MHDNGNWPDLEFGGTLETLETSLVTAIRAHKPTNWKQQTKNWKQIVA